jgi:transposase InsO family protein
VHDLLFTLSGDDYLFPLPGRSPVERRQASQDDGSGSPLQEASLASVDDSGACPVLTDIRDQGLVKTELIHRRTWPTRKAATSAIFDYIEGWYNTRRRHSTLGYLSPAQYESTITAIATAKQIA